MNPLVRISIDTLGGDYGLDTTIQASIDAIEQHSDLTLILVGNEGDINHTLASHKLPQALTKRIEVVHTTQVIEMDESPIKALKHKKDSSMYAAIKLVKDKAANACVSAGNTGALMAISKSLLRMIPGISRPAIFGKIPTIKGYAHMLDLGANVDSKPQTLLEFALMGSITIEHTQNIKRPSIGLLNIGQEEIKGNSSVKETAQLLHNSSLNYAGFIEGDDIYKGDIDLIVTDGFVGNITLKASEGVASMMSHYLKQSFTKNTLTKISALISQFVLKDFRQRLDPRNYNGAAFLGLQGVVIKSHGGADAFAFLQAIKEARLESYANIAEQVKTRLENELERISTKDSTQQSNG